MFASVWQLLTVIFFISALTKLVYKLIKEANDGQLRREIVSGGRRHRSVVISAEEAQRTSIGDTTTTSVGLVQQQQQPDEEERAQVAIGGGEREHREEDSSEDLASSGEQEVEERRLQVERQLQRQQFRRQLRAVLISANEVPPTVRSLQHSQTLPSSLAPAAASHSPDGTLNRSSLSDRRQNVSGSGDNTDSDKQQQQSFARRQHEDKDGAREQNGAAKEGENEEETQRKQSSTARVASLLAIILIDTFLLEPFKFFGQILSNSLRVFCTLLDAIEGIEPETIGEEGEGAAVGGAPLESRRQLNARPAHTKLSLSTSEALKQVDSSSHSLKAQRRQQRQGGPRAPHRRPNYFHRRYLSRRSLSAALLDEAD